MKLVGMNFCLIDKVKLQEEPAVKGGVSISSPYIMHGK